MATVILRTESVGGAAVAAIEVPDVPQSMTARELIRLRAREEFAGRFPDAPPQDREQQADLAERAFRANGFFLLVGDRQVEELDEAVDLRAAPEVLFLRLLPLVGG
jgi:hypothetical protein